MMPGRSRCWRTLAARVLLAMPIVIALVSSGQAEPAAGLTRPIVLPPYDSNRPSCRAPDNVGKVLAFVQDNDRKFMQGVAAGLTLAARDRGIAYRNALAGNNANLMIEQVRGFLDARVGALVVAPVNPASLAPLLRDVIASGAYVGAVVPPPATTILNAPQYLTGKTLGDEAARYIRTRLGGKAKVVLFTHDSLKFLSPRFTAIRDSLRALPGVEIIADISPATVDEAGGAAMMKTILLVDEKIDVILGADTVVLGALAALREAGKARPDQFLGGIDGEPAAIAEIKADGPYKASISLASPIFSYAMGQQAADWLDGKSIPQAIDILPTALTRENIDKYEAEVSDPGAVYRDKSRRDRYLKMYGNICFDTRNEYLDFAWSSEN